MLYQSEDIKTSKRTKEESNFPWSGNIRVTKSRLDQFCFWLVAKQTKSKFIPENFWIRNLSTTLAREKRRNKIKQINKGDQKALELKQVLTVVCRIVVLGTFQTFRSQVRYEILYSALEQAVTLCQNVQLKYTWREILIKIPWPFWKKELPFLLNWTKFFFKVFKFYKQFSLFK